MPNSVFVESVTAVPLLESCYQLQLPWEQLEEEGGKPNPSLQSGPQCQSLGALTLQEA